MTGAGTNTYVYGADPCVVIDPGVDDPDHIGKVQRAADDRGGVSAVLISHEHRDHVGGADRFGVPVIKPSDGERHGGLLAIATPGHAADHVCLVVESEGDGGACVCFCGDLVLGEGSSIVPPDGGSLIAYLDSLHRVRDLAPGLMCPGHGPWITDPRSKIDEYIEHRMMRERRLLAEIENGERSRDLLLDRVWNDTPVELRNYAALVMQAHLEKLQLEGRLPEGFEFD